MDSITFHFRQDFLDMAQRTRLLSQMAQQLLHLAQLHDVAVRTWHPSMYIMYQFGCRPFEVFLLLVTSPSGLSLKEHTWIIQESSDSLDPPVHFDDHVDNPLKSSNMFVSLLIH